MRLVSIETIALLSTEKIQSWSIISVLFLTFCTYFFVNQLPRNYECDRWLKIFSFCVKLFRTAVCFSVVKIVRLSIPKCGSQQGCSTFLQSWKLETIWRLRNCKFNIRIDMFLLASCNGLLSGMRGMVLLTLKSKGR